MQKFHSKMTPRSLCTQFPLTEITYAKVCISHGMEKFRGRMDRIMAVGGPKLLILKVFNHFRK